MSFTQRERDYVNAFVTKYSREFQEKLRDMDTITMTAAIRSVQMALEEPGSMLHQVLLHSMPPELKQQITIGGSLVLARELQKRMAQPVNQTLSTKN